MTSAAQNKVIAGIFEYEDYRKFLMDYFREQKRLRKTFSHRYFARIAGFSSPSYFNSIATGKVNLTCKSLPKMLKGLGLGKKASEYFKALVHLNQASDPSEKQRYRMEIERIRRRTCLYRLEEKRAQYLSEWYNQVLREAAALADWGGDFSRLGKLLIPPVSASKAEAAVKLLCEMELLRKTEDGRYLQTDAGVSVEGLPAAMIRRARRQMAELGIDAAERLEADERYVAHTTMTVSRETYLKITEILDKARTETIELALSDSQPEKVFEMMLQLFPLTGELNAKRGKRS